MRTKATLIFFLFLFGVTVVGCDNRKSATSQEVTNSNTISQTQNIQQQKETTQEEYDKEAWKEATKTTEYDSSRYHKPLP
jgi:uncharacterized membrane protein